MEATKAVQLLVLLLQATQQLPALIAALRSTFSAEDEAELQAQLASLREQNEAQYEAVVGALRATAAS